MNNVVTYNVKRIGRLTLETIEGPAWHGRNPARRFVAEIAANGVSLALGWGPTRSAAARAARAAFKARLARKVA